jgi:hypothetical protein
MNEEFKKAIVGLVVIVAGVAILILFGTVVAAMVHNLWIGLTR